MSDQLYLSYWIKGFTEHNMFRHFAAALGKFPYSRLRPRALLQVRAVDLTEPVLFEREFSGNADAATLTEAMRWHRSPDSAFEIETAWDLWSLTGEEEWKLQPAPVRISCYAPLFPSEYGEQIRFEFGPDTQFLPQLELTWNLAPVRQNIQSLLHLVQDLDESLAVEKRQLWSESGENFAERLQQALAE